MLPTLIATESVVQCNWWANASIILPAIIAAISGLFGVGIGCFLSSFLSKRNWQLGKAAEAYANLFPAGRREIALLQNLAAGHIFDANPLEAIQSSRERLKGKIESVFLQATEECWLFEKDSYLRDSLVKIRKGYDQYREHANDCSHQIINRMTLKTEIEIGPSVKYTKSIESYKGPKGEDLLKDLDVLREILAKKYFH